MHTEWYGDDAGYELSCDSEKDEVMLRQNHRGLALEMYMNVKDLRRLDEQIQLLLRVLEQVKEKP